MRLIDADKLEISMIAEFNDEYGDTVPVYGVTAEDIDNAPTVDAIVLPVKVGQTVYRIDDTRVYELTVTDVCDIIYDTNAIAFSQDVIGYRIFLTREDAEAALKARESK